ncbi:MULTISPECIES: proline-specific peptidase family protein [Latilactobacillus]|jgi:proline iminopeptidase|uniref:Proline iminopeptidase n=2 Tax=Latilactobacillus curvatus TaxID=28038 RepID=A0A0B2XP17_LATCU|nr:proline-specific peptidase family protein [Latilactobacillus curvatus]ANJ68656.1 prolyl aminopeptidase [Latilactobacillus curvatus]ASN60934.1 prolyl aminopeptidase [Latilactobacillus curvatus]ASN62808.1 prolyl aminopeptidase [Latilactobacillus curvatus]AWV73710.1 alpha/beta fold hydrolase [Latilactobacillus curvatus]EHE85140.1 proline-specific peptidases family protein [Latilactobacillus curvatus CRL 705]
MKQGTTILTLDNGYHLWTNTQGTGDIHLLCLHGGPGGNHEYWENFGKELADLGVQVHMYDQLGSFYSDQPDYSQPGNDQLLTYDYFLDEVEEVRQKLGIDNFYLIGQSWGGALVQMYAAKYGQHLKGAIISSMVDEIDEYVTNINKIREDIMTPEQLKFMQDCEAKNDYDNDEYQALVDKLNAGYVDRKQPLAISHLIPTMATDVYGVFQGDNEFVVTGKLKDWHFRDQLHKITVPTLITFGEHETMPIATAKIMAEKIPHARLVTTPNGGHHHMIDNAPVYFDHLKTFIKDVENGNFND